jgi:predicted nucleic acid-binding Zn ribbon protein
MGIDPNQINDAMLKLDISGELRRIREKAAGHCAQCGEKLPETRTKRRIYCSVKCNDSAKKRRSRTGDKVVREGQKKYSFSSPLPAAWAHLCQMCGKKLPKDRPRSRRFCGQRCQFRYWKKNKKFQIWEAQQKNLTPNESYEETSSQASA